MEQQNRTYPSYTVNILWIGWLVVFFGLGIWTGHFGIPRNPLQPRMISGSSEITQGSILSQTPATTPNHVHAVHSHPSPQRAGMFPVHGPATGQASVGERPSTQEQTQLPHPVVGVEDLPQISWHLFSVAQRRQILQIVNEWKTPCSCGQSLARCVQTDWQRCASIRQTLGRLMKAVYEEAPLQTIRERIKETSSCLSVPQATSFSLSAVSSSLMPEKVYYVPVEKDNPDYGSAHAKLTVVIFSDFECPHCWGVMKDVHRLEKKYGQREVRVVFRHYPLLQHPHAWMAAEASLAAHAQGKFWLYHDQLFRNQNHLTSQDLVGYAKALNLDIGRFQKELNQSHYKNRVHLDRTLALRLKLPGVPFVFINGIPVLQQQTILDVAQKAWLSAEEVLRKQVPRYALYSTLIQFGQREP